MLSKANTTNPPSSMSKSDLLIFHIRWKCLWIWVYKYIAYTAYPIQYTGWKIILNHALSHPYLCHCHTSSFPSSPKVSSKYAYSLAPYFPLSDALYCHVTTEILSVCDTLDTVALPSWGSPSFPRCHTNKLPSKHPPAADIYSIGKQLAEIIYGNYRVDFLIFKLYK